MQKRRIERIAILICAGVVSAAITGWVVSPKWQPTVVVLFLFLLTSILLIAIRRQGLSMRKLIQGQVNQNAKLHGNLSDRIVLIDEAVRRNEIRLRQAGQANKQLAGDTKALQKKFEELLKHGAENEARLRQIGQLVKGRDSPTPTYVPLALRHHSGGLNSIGRLAAAVRSDTSRSERILNAADSSGFARGAGGRRKVGIVGTAALQDFLHPDVESCLYLPSMCVAQNEQFRPTTILIEERVVLSGVWSGALSSSGIALYDEICQIVDAVVRTGGSVYFLRNVGVADTNTQDLESRSFVITSESEFTTEWSAGMKIRFLEELKSYCAIENGI